jgi:hypothetical protein
LKDPAWFDAAEDGTVRFERVRVPAEDKAACTGTSVAWSQQDLVRSLAKLLCILFEIDG